MTNNTGSSYSKQVESSIDRELSSEQWHAKSDPNAQTEELLDTVFSLYPFYNGFFWGGIFAITSVVSAIAGASLTHFQSVSETMTNLLVEYNLGNSPVLSTSTESPPIPSLIEPVNLLIVGIQERDNSPSEIDSTSTYQDTAVLLFRFQPQNNFVSITTIPQDSKVEIPGLGLGTIQQAHSYGGIDMVSQVVSKTLDDLEIDRYIKATPTTLLKLIDLLGGVEVFISPESLDNQGKQKFNITSGWQNLDGKQVVEFILQDNQDNRSNQIRQQQILIEALRQRLHNPSLVDNLPQIVQVLQNYLDTDLTLPEIKSLLGFLHQLERDEVIINLIPNYGRQPKFAQDNFIISSKEGDRTSNDKQYSYSGHSWRNIPISIQNTTNNPELSLQVLEYLISKGFYNVYLNKYGNLQLNQTEIVAQSKDLSAANYVRQILNIGKVEISDLNDNDSELTIRLGKDAKFIFLDDDYIR